MASDRLNDRLGHLAYVLLAVGLILVGQYKSTWGWPVYIMGCGLWTWIGLRMRMTSIWIWSSLFLANAVASWYTWSA